jgi:hypothetical protein
MNDAATRIKTAVELLASIEIKRAQANDPNLGAAMEHAVIAGHLRELEADILNDPGAMEPWLVRRHRP